VYLNKFYLGFGPSKTSSLYATYSLNNSIYLGTTLRTRIKNFKNTNNFALEK